MDAGREDSDYYTIEVPRDLPLAEQLHQANTRLCFEVSATKKVFLEDVRFRNGYKVLRYRFWRE
ncbi:MAG: hypothetical protein JSU72_17510 [Deltaproteobacteria bacterium]|nr:MAG: hypothetical protein JSU72_17510 [Deltaproteobacteria bacterium]